MLIGRASGLLLHPTSLSNPYGVGDLGPGAVEFLDWLAGARQRVWQMLPLGPTDQGNSPYQSPSAFAGNPALISLDWLAEDGLLDPGELQRAVIQDGSAAPRVDFDAVRRRKWPLLGAAARRLISSRGPLTREFDDFCRKQSDWLDSFAAFMSLKDANYGKAWCDWTQGVDAHRRPLPGVSNEVQEAQQFHRALQFLFFRQWQRLRKLAHERGVLLIGDVPIYVSYDCADVWSHRELFQLDEDGRPTHVAGVPPDYFSATGQLWNNPLYDWNELRQSGYRWWIRRMQAALAEVDMVRLDHFRGFEAFWSVPFGEPTAENGEWVTGPGADFLQALADHLSPSSAAASLIEGLPVIAEDLGMITKPVHELREQFGLPGMNVLQFILPGEPDNPPDLQAFETNSVAYTGTHDNDTTLGWFRTEIMPRADRWERLRQWTAAREETISWEFVTLAWQSSSRLAVAPVQDILALGTEARMNTPGTFGEEHPNWQWRLLPGQLTDQLAQDLGDLTIATGRVSS